jgi:hypothetical protein
VLDSCGKFRHCCVYVCARRAGGGGIGLKHVAEMCVGEGGAQTARKVALKESATQLQKANALLQVCAMCGGWLGGSLRRVGANVSGECGFFLGGGEWGQQLRATAEGRARQREQQWGVERAAFVLMEVAKVVLCYALSPPPRVTPVNLQARLSLTSTAHQGVIKLLCTACLLC